MLKLELIFGKTVYINPTYIIYIGRAEDPPRYDADGNLVKFYDIAMIDGRLFRVPEIELDKLVKGTK